MQHRNLMETRVLEVFYSGPLLGDVGHSRSLLDVTRINIFPRHNVSMARESCNARMYCGTQIRRG